MQQQISEYDILQRKYSISRSNLLIMAAMTAVNIICIITNANFSFPFSAVLPQIAVVFGIELGNFYNIPAFKTAGMIAAAISIILYFICWYFSKKKSGWMIAALVLYSIDILGLIFGLFTAKSLGTSLLLQVAFSAWVMYYLIVGVKAGVKLKNMTPPTIEAEARNVVTVTNENPQENTPATSQIIPENETNSMPDDNKE